LNLQLQIKIRRKWNRAFKVTLQHNYWKPDIWY